MGAARLPVLSTHSAPYGRIGCATVYRVGVGTSFTEYRGSGFWTRDAPVAGYAGAAAPGRG
jgi:hypothetical protein